MQNKRMHNHDYTRVGFYMVTILTASRNPIFGNCRDNQVQLSPIGELVSRRWQEIPEHRPQVEVSDLVVMPDHLHGIVYVKEPLAKPVGDTIRGFKSGVTSALRKQCGNPEFDIWEEGFHDRVIMCSETLKTERQYIRDNPRRFCMRNANPELFTKVNHLNAPWLPDDMDWTGFGNLFLLRKVDFVQVQVSRRVSAPQLSAVKEEVLRRVSGGSVMVSPFISPGEQEIARRVMAQDYGSLILLKPDGFPPVYKPSGSYFDLCAKGRLLILSSFAYTGRRQRLTRERCLQMNKWVQSICAGRTCGKNAAPQ